MVLGLPHPLARLHDRVRARGVPGHVAHPGVPARLDLRGVVERVMVVDPARAQRELVRRVLEVPVAVAVGRDVGAGFGVADVHELVAVFLRWVAVSGCLEGWEM